MSNESFVELEIYVPASPHPFFYNMIRCQAASLRTFGGVASNAKYVVLIGDLKANPHILNELPWSKDLNIEWRCINPEIYARHGIVGTMLSRFSQDFSDNSMVLMLDADVLITNDLKPLLNYPCCFAGLPAHFSPFTELQWDYLFEKLDILKPNKSWKVSYSGIVDVDIERIHPYFNSGVMIASSIYMKLIGSIIFKELKRVKSIMNNWAMDQIITSLALLILDIPRCAIPFRFNFPNETKFIKIMPNEFSEIKLLHYLRSNKQFNRFNVFKSNIGLKEFLYKSDLVGINAFFQNKLLSLKHLIID
jgi:hypothetical protein